jgi:hypothetical protein
LKVENKRYKDAQKDIRNYGEWPWLLHKQTFSGVTLKHTVDNMTGYSRELECVEGSSMNNVESYFMNFLESGYNI